MANHYTACLDKAYHKKFYSALQNKNFKIPRYQRFYEWDNQLIEQYIYDILDHIKRKTNLFIGIFIFKKIKTGQTLVIDGQQRIITTLILLRSLTYMEELNKDDRKDINNFLKNIELKGHLLELNEEKRREFFGRFILNDQPKSVDQYNQNITGGIKSSKDLIDQILRKNKKKINKIFRFLEKHIESTIIQLDERTEETEIFESVNSKKIELSNTDLIKSHLFYLCYDQKKKKSDEKKSNQVSKKWDELFKYFKKSKELERFLNIYWLAKRGSLINKKYELFRQFKRKEKRSPVIIMNELLLYAKSYLIINYQKIYDEKHHKVIDWKPISERDIGAFESLHYIKKMGITIGYPLILKSLVKNKTKFTKNMVTLIKLTETYSFLRRAIIRDLPQKIKDDFSNFTNKHKDINTTNEKLKGDLKNLKDDMVREIKVNSLSKTYSVYMLYRILSYSYSSSGLPRFENFFKEKNQEHIMPEKSETNPKWRNLILTIIRTDDEFKSWRELSSNDRIDNYKNNFLNLIGNHSLLLRPDNSRAGNKDFAKKIEIYKKYEGDNPLFLWVNQQKEWDHTKIRDRSEILMLDYFKIFI